MSTCILSALLLAGCASDPSPSFSVAPGASNVGGTTRSDQTSADFAVPDKRLSQPRVKDQTQKPDSNKSKAATTSVLLVTPSHVLQGRVAVFNAAGQFVVVNFPIGHLPALDQRMDVYRKGLKVGEVVITGPHRDDHIVGDVITGEASPGDEVRARQ